MIFHSRGDHIGIFWSLPSFVFSQVVVLILMTHRLCCQLLRRLSNFQQNGFPSQIPDRLFANRHRKRKSHLRLNDTGYFWKERRYRLSVDYNRAVHGNSCQSYVVSQWADPNFHHYGRCRINNVIFLNVY